MPLEFQRVLVANRSEIAIRVFRACTELGIRTIGIYSNEDRGALHRYKADETYLVGDGLDPLKAYMDIPSIMEIAKRHGADAIHPGYGFLSENPNFARACEEAGIKFIGPPSHILELMGDKTAARRTAQSLGIPIIPGTDEPLVDEDTAVEKAAEIGYPVILKASYGGGGRGMRVCHSEADLRRFFKQAQNEAALAFGHGELFLEKYLSRPKHIEVQILADEYGNTVHLFERDCSVQRRHQKVIEIAPSPSLDPKIREQILEAAVRLAKHVGYINAGTVEFLVDSEGGFYFIEMNPRIQVEHTVTEMVTGIDIVKAQIRIAEGHTLDSPEIGIKSQEDVSIRGYAVQCRITTEDPTNDFMPDYGRITHYRSAAGFGIRLDAGTAFTGAVITPYYDSLLVKVTSWSLTFQDACRKLGRALAEFRVRGVKTNIPFLENVVRHPVFLSGNFTTSFIEETPELFVFPERADRASKLLQFIAEVSINGNPDVKSPRPAKLRQAVVPPYDPNSPIPPGTRDLFKQLGPEKFSKWILEQRRVLITDTTLRDAHQSLLATRMRTYDMLRIAPAKARLLSGLFSLEMWGGATFDVSMRFLHEDPWERLALLREAIPNILFQMLLRGANAVGYSNYPDNVVHAFVKEAVDAGIDLFRIFDSLNWVPGMISAIEAVREAGAIAEAAICYTGDIFDPSRSKYNLKYYVDLAKELERLGANILAIKDMAGLLRPYAARKLISTLKQEIGIPIHLHTHDTAGVQAASILFAVEAGVDIIDAAFGALSGLTSQPNLESIVAALARQERDTGLDFDQLLRFSDYWEVVREYYAPFESGMKASSADVYIHEIPGGQYSNLRPQAEALGLGDRLPELKRMYAVVNHLLGDVVKVTPSSKAVGDLALFMMTNNLTPEDLLEKGEELSFPESVVSFFAGEMGQPLGGFPERLQQVILKGKSAPPDGAAKTLQPIDLEATRQQLAAKIGRPVSQRDLLSYLMYPKVFLEFVEHQRRYSNVMPLPTPAFFYGLKPGEEITVDIEKGKTLFIKLVAVSEPDEEGVRSVFFELNGHPREVRVVDASVGASVQRHIKADPENPHHVGAPMPGMVVEVPVHPGQMVEKDQTLVVVEAMKMQTNVASPRAGRIKDVFVARGTRVDTGDLLVTFE